MREACRKEPGKSAQARPGAQATQAHSETASSRGRRHGCDSLSPVTVAVPARHLRPLPAQEVVLTLGLVLLPCASGAGGGASQVCVSDVMCFCMRASEWKVPDESARGWTAHMDGQTARVPLAGQGQELRCLYAVDRKAIERVVL